MSSGFYGPEDFGSSPFDDFLARIYGTGGPGRAVRRVDITRLMSGPARELEQEDQPIVHAGQPAHTEEWRQSEPFEPEYLEEELPPGQQPGTPAGLSPADVDRRFDIARWLEPHKFPADRDTMLGYLRGTGAPDEVIDAISSLPARREFTNTADVTGALGIPTEHR